MLNTNHVTSMEDIR